MKNILAKCLNILFKCFIFISSYIPIFIMIFLNNLKKFNSVEFKNTVNMNRNFWISLLLISVISLITLFLWLIIITSISRKKDKTSKIDKLKSYDSEILNYFITYIIPILSLKPDSYPSIVMNAILLFIEGIYFISNNALQYNIVLIIFGYHIYTFQNDHIIITRKKKSEIEFCDLKAAQIATTNFYYI
ncbi:hypothetical protein [Apilactobacillus timberlakei]|uniref:hypothetical protein n=1 Tax=Apilactobacillus timberlakei TaxID=2008380 RepID=UPI0011270DC4|nr:hypothetical protein [Apilactobacillus timberlakei]TPR12621.1 hypothetical protein DYZ97_06055 [Apilactobacillus timberlakei]